jgi:hypothetical protein
MRQRMRVLWVFLVAWSLLLPAITPLSAAAKADFAVSNITVRGDGFVYIHLKNKSNSDVRIPPSLKEKVFLIIYINSLKRAEYKIKYIDPKLFKKRGIVVLRTNFRAKKPLNVRAEINPLKVIPEKNFSDNRFVKTVSARK